MFGGVPSARAESVRGGRIRGQIATGTADGDQVLMAGMKTWLAGRDYDLRRADLRMLFKQWELS
jgi:hypothetical protein